jgi:copper transport protein
MPHDLASVMLAAAPYSAPAPWRVISEWAFFIGLIGTIGVGLLNGAVVRPVLARASVNPSDRMVLKSAATVLLAVIGTWFLIALYFQLAATVARASKGVSYGEALSPGRIAGYLGASAGKGEWISAGGEALIQFALWAVAALLLIALWVPSLRGRTGTLAWTAAGIAFVSWLVTAIPTNMGKATADSVADGLFLHLHVLAISTWVGGVAGLTLLSMARQRLTPTAGATWAQLWARFSTVALIAVGCILFSGAWLAWKHLGSPAELFTTPYGRFLLIKLLLVATIVVAGAVNELVLMPRIARARAAGEEGSVFRLAVRVFPRVVGLEFVLALCVLVVVPFLAGSSRSEAGDDPDPVATGTVIGIGILWIVVLAVSFYATAKVSARLSAAGAESGRALGAAAKEPVG